MWVSCFIYMRRVGVCVYVCGRVGCVEREEKVNFVACKGIYADNEHMDALGCYCIDKHIYELYDFKPRRPSSRYGFLGGG